MAKSTAKEQKRNEKGEFVPAEDGGREPREYAERPGSSEAREDFEGSLERPGLTASEGGSRIEDLLATASDEPAELPEGMDPEEL